MREHDYWREQGKTYKAVFDGFSGAEAAFFKEQENAILSKVGELFNYEEPICETNPPFSVLEAGCGFGRVTRRMLDAFDIERYVAFDISGHQAAEAVRVCPEAAVQSGLSIEEYDAEKVTYDLVLAVEVLLHIPPTRIADVMARMLDWASGGGYVLHVDQWPPPEGRYELTKTPEGPISYQRVPFNWYHDYAALWRSLGVPGGCIEMTQISDRQVMVVVEGP